MHDRAPFGQIPSCGLLPGSPSENFQESELLGRCFAGLEESCEDTLLPSTGLRFSNENLFEYVALFQSRDERVLMTQRRWILL